MQKCEVDAVTNGSGDEPGDQVAIEIELLDVHVLNDADRPNDWWHEETAEGSGNGTVDEKRDVIFLELESISDEASNSAAQKNKRALRANGSTTPQRYKCLKQDAGQVTGVEAASLGVLTLGVTFMLACIDMLNESNTCTYCFKLSIFVVVLDIKFENLFSSSYGISCLSSSTSCCNASSLIADLSISSRECLLLRPW